MCTIMMDTKHVYRHAVSLVRCAGAVQAWVLDTLPGEVRAGGPGRADHPADLIAALRRIPLPIADRNGVMDYLVQSGARSGVH